MCTVTVHRAGGGLRVTMNRDERRDRPAEGPPAVHDAAGGAPAWVAPVDTASGGSWIAANDCGLVAFLLNLYQHGGNEPTREGDVEPAVSRGAIVMEAAARGGLMAARGWLRESFDPSPYQPFTLGLASPEGLAVCRWTGRGEATHETVGREWFMVSSSSWRTAEALAWRARAFERWLAAGGAFEGRLPSFHLLRPAGEEAWAPMMSRETTHTRSVTRVEVERGERRVWMGWWPAPVVDPERAVADVELALGDGQDGQDGRGGRGEEG